MKDTNSKKEEEKTTESTAGFQRKVRVKGEAETDKLFNERLVVHKKEIDEFYAKHPDLKEKPFED